MAEWLKALVLKTSDGKPFVSSNLTASARQVARRQPGTAGHEEPKGLHELGSRKKLWAARRGCEGKAGSTGSVAEWLKALVLKTSDGKLFVSSNLTASARQVAKRRQSKEGHGGAERSSMSWAPTLLEGDRGVAQLAE